MTELNIAIIGAGLGGLTLAHALRRAGADVRVFERDASPWDRPQGYRLHIDTDGIEALAAALTDDLNRLFRATSMEPLDYTTIVDAELNILGRRGSDDHSGTQERGLRGATAHLNVNRATLREILLTDLSDICHFGAKFLRYESGPDGVTAHFADGNTVRADVLVGADGVHSRVRRQRAPEARLMDTGVRAIYGRIPLPAAARLLPDHALEDVFTVASGPGKVFLGLGPVVFPARPEIAGREFAPTAGLRPQEDYVVCIVGGPRKMTGKSDDALRAMGSAGLQSLAAHMLRDWPEAARAIPPAGDPASFFHVEMRSSVPFDLAPHANVTLLGDAVHAMTPTLGRGANVAMQDALMLSRVLRAVGGGELELAEALAAYEREMTEQGFAVVRQAAALGERLMGQLPLPG